MDQHLECEDLMSDNSEKHLDVDFKVRLDQDGGFVFVFLEDTDDGDKFMLNEDRIVVLHRYLGEVIKQHNLNSTDRNTLTDE